MPFLRRKKPVTKTTECHSAELIGYQTRLLSQKYYTVLISKHQFLKACQGFSVFLMVIFLKTCKAIVSNNLPALLQENIQNRKNVLAKILHTGTLYSFRTDFSVDLVPCSAAFFSQSVESNSHASYPTISFILLK